ncbi:MAG: SDR family NAD(P)-dependent oxidoreductase [Roseiarcus sp.]
MHMCKAVVPHLIARGGGAIVCIGSLAAQRGGGIFGAAPHAASKGGVHSLAKALAHELGPHNVRVNDRHEFPGLIDEFVPCGAAVVDDIVEGLEDAV